MKNVTHRHVAVQLKNDYGFFYSSPCQRNWFEKRKPKKGTLEKRMKQIMRTFSIFLAQ